MKYLPLLLLLLFSPGILTAQDLHTLFPVDEIAGWNRIEAPKLFRGEELFLMIDGGADIYFEYGFSKVLAGDYENERGELLRLEIYEMASPSAAYGMYSFKRGPGGKALAIGQEALLEGYYLNIWKENLLITIVGPDSNPAAADSVTAFARYIDERYPQRGTRPKLAELLLSDPFPFSQPKYILGTIGAMNSYVFDTEDIFRVEEGMVGAVLGMKVFVFRYEDKEGRDQIFAQATAAFKAGTRFREVAVDGDYCSMIDRNNNYVLMLKEGRDIVIAIGENKQKSAVMAKKIAAKLHVQ